MGVNTGVAEQVRRSTFGREMRKPIADGCEYTATDEIVNAAKNAVIFAKEEAEDELDSSLRRGGYSLQIFLKSGEEELEEAAGISKRKIDSALKAGIDSINRSLIEELEVLEEELQHVDQGLAHFYAVLEEAIAAVAEIRQDGNARLDVISAKCDMRVTAVNAVPIPGSEEDVKMVITLGGDDNG